MNIISYEDKYEAQWDAFVNDTAVNGALMHTRNFLAYHPKGKFEDCSCLIFDGDELAGIVPACVKTEAGKKAFFSHAGASYGGIVVNHEYYNGKKVIEMVDTLENFVKEAHFGQIILKITPDLFCREKSDLLQYVLRYRGYSDYCELAAYIDYADYKQDLIANISSHRLRKLKTALKNNLEFRILTEDEDVRNIHAVITKNYLKFETKPIHSAEEMLDFKNKRLPDKVVFVAAYSGGTMAAGGMLFLFGKVAHAQYLSQDYDFDDVFPNVYLYHKTIEWARDHGFEKLSFGINTTYRGAVLNTGLLDFKESFGSKHAVNRTYYKEL
ncbi:GNAT family N-acetyltransferase [Leadbettera azotonutricia]|uniref:BioF2-like acetyltransferase domain-containing protein n=1 Tax=Leadbettera azotonutricia (strain ATCC BAA-888 / DSM 13862 / ZAS-9) TaxID=545695 RepID=F5Y771_LEAAZ|nr:GNAT family N-acetyltransferase [Leadbettera azotonutricia]AEF81613.1 conserved hypothetical protein [Leadbettera azotonutricia ZAS-9]